MIVQPLPPPTTKPPPPPPPEPPDPADSPAGRFLTDPDGTVRGWAQAVLDAVSSVALRWGWVMLVALVVAGLVVVLVRRARTCGVSTGARLVHIACPPAVERRDAELLWSYLHDLLRPRWRRLVSGQPHLVFEYRFDEGGTDIRVWVPGRIPPGLVERAIEAAWPGARTTTGDSTPPLPADAAATGGELRLAHGEWLPLRTDHGADPLRSLVGAVVGLRAGEVVCVQVLARPVTGRRLARAHAAVRAIAAGLPATRRGKLLDLLTPDRRIPASADPDRAALVGAVLDKAARPGWEALVRYGVATRRSGDVRGWLRGRAHAVASASALYAGRNRLARHRLRRPERVLARRHLRRGGLVSVAELAGLAHLPTDITTSGMARAGARPLPAPPGAPRAGKVLGDAEVGDRRPVALSPADARFHLHVLGATGSGKSTLLANLILGDIAAARGCVVIDPKGDLVADVLARLPAGAGARVALLDPDRPEVAPALDVLGGDNHHLVVDHLVGIFRRIFDRYWGPRTDDILRAACLTLCRHPDPSLADVPLLLGDARVRERFTAGIDDPVGLGGFWDWYEGLSGAEQARVVGPVLNKLRAFLLRDFVRRVVGPGRHAVDLGAVLDGGVLLVRIPKGTLGDETTRLLGSLVVARVWQAAAARAEVAESSRADASLVVDECQNFLNLPRSFEEMLAEARGYRLSLVLAHQHLAQLPRELADAVSANARTKVFFACSPEDAARLARHVEPELGAHDLTNLDRYQAAVRLVADGRELPACTVRTRPAPPPRCGCASLGPGPAGSARRDAEQSSASAARLDPGLRGS